MTNEEFYQLIAAELKENQALSADTHFKQLDNYGSLSAVLILQWVEEHFGVKINPRAFRNFNTLADLQNAIGREKFS